jgi:hypothetical protein
LCDFNQTPQPAPRAEYAAEFLSAENQPENMRCAALAGLQLSILNTCGI